MCGEQLHRARVTPERLGTKVVAEWRAPRDLSVAEAAEVHREMCLAATEAFRVVESRRR